MMRRVHGVTAATSIATACSLVPIALGYSSGADPGLSGGPFGYRELGWGNCTFCHDFNAGGGRVELAGLPRRYRPGADYTVTVRITDPQQAGAGFEISAEGGGQHRGQFQVIDPINTLAIDFQARYITHTRDGVDDSIANWSGSGGSYDYVTRWFAPLADEGAVTVYVSGNAIDDDNSPFGDRYYAGHAMLHYAVPGDADGDTDVDLRDAATLQQCVGRPDGGQLDPCRFLDDLTDNDNAVALTDLPAFVTALTGPTAADPADFVLADKVRGGLLYDKWWVAGRVSEPTGEHPLYPDDGPEFGADTFRCTACHGWDYRGAAGIAGIAQTTRTPAEIFALLTADPAETPDGHDMDAFGMSEADLWNAVKMTLEGVVDTDVYIDMSGAFLGNEASGSDWFGTVCSSCHGFDGTAINFGDAKNAVFVGTVANDDPWRFLHKVRFGHPGAPMPATELLEFDVTTAADIGAYAQTLPTE